MDPREKMREAILILRAHRYRTNEYDDKISMYKEFPHLLIVAKPDVVQRWNSRNPSRWFITDFRVFVVYLCKQGVVVQTKEFPPTKTYYSENKFIEWQGGVRYSLHMEQNTIRLVGINYGGPNETTIVYEKIFLSTETDMGIINELVDLFENVTGISGGILLPALSFKNSNIFLKFEMFISSALATLEHL